jgi:hypothetical protein
MLNYNPMKNIKIFGLVSSLVLLASCQEEFLETYPTASLSQEQVSAAVAVNPDAAKGTLLGIYQQLYARGSGGTSAQEDFGVHLQHMNLDILSQDMAHLGKSYSRQRSISEMTTTLNPDDSFNYMPWRFLYRIINLSNLVIDGLGGDQAELTTSVQKHTMGQALAARGWAYFYLNHLFVNDISNLTGPSVPVYTASDQLEQPKSTVGEVFNQAIADLEKAEVLLDGFVRSDKIEFNQDVVRGVLAYTYGAMNNWTKTYEYADKVVNAGYGKMSPAEITVLGPDDTVGGFNDVNAHQAIMWGVTVTSSQELASLFTWWGFMDVFSYSYAAVGNHKGMDAGLYDKFRADDIRKTQFPYAGKSLGYVPAFKFYNTTAQAKGWRTFSGPQVNVDSDAHYMRSDEFYLLKAEAAAELGDEATAKTTLKNYLSDRITDVSYIDALSGAALQEEISTQTRLELFGEGKSYFLMKRQRQSRTRGANWLDYKGETFSHNDERLTYELPTNELLFNPNITDQN